MMDDSKKNMALPLLESADSKEPQTKKLLLETANILILIRVKGLVYYWDNLAILKT